MRRFFQRGIQEELGGIKYMSALGIFVQMQGDLSRLETESFLKIQMKTDEDETGGFKSGKDPQGEYIKRLFIESKE